MLKNYKTFLIEKYLNLYPSTKDEITLKQKYADDVYNMIQESYKEIGGIKGSGFESPEDMVKKIPFWKLYFKNGQLLAVMMFKKGKGGVSLKKTVAIGSNGTKEGSKAIKHMIYEEVKQNLLFIKKEGRSYGEMSLAPLHIVRKHVLPDNGWEEKDFFIKASDAAKILAKEGKEVEITGEYTYKRKIGDDIEEKMMYGLKKEDINKLIGENSLPEGCYILNIC